MEEEKRESIVADNILSKASILKERSENTVIRIHVSALEYTTLLNRC